MDKSKGEVWIEESDNMFWIYTTGTLFATRGRVLRFHAYERNQAETYKRLLIREGYKDRDGDRH